MSRLLSCWPMLPSLLSVVAVTYGITHEQWFYERAGCGGMDDNSVVGFVFLGVPLSLASLALALFACLRSNPESTVIRRILVVGSAVSSLLCIFLVGDSAFPDLSYHCR